MEPFGYYDYDVSQNGKVQHFGNARNDYSTDVFTRKANQFLRASSQSSDPFLLWLAYEAPHAGKTSVPPCVTPSAAAPPDRASIRAVEDIPLPRPPSFNERNVSDKPKRPGPPASESEGHPRDHAHLKLRARCRRRAR